MNTPPYVYSLHPNCPKGWEQLLVVRNACRAFMTGDNGEITPEKQEAFRQRFNVDRQRAYLIGISGQDALASTPRFPMLTVGFMYLRRERPHLWVPTYGVHEDFRGQGYGKFLVRLSQSLVNHMILEVKESNEIARALYEDCNFRVIEVNERAVVMEWQR